MEMNHPQLLQRGETACNKLMHMTELSVSIQFLVDGQAFGIFKRPAGLVFEVLLYRLSFEYFAK